MRYLGEIERLNIVLRPEIEELRNEEIIIDITLSQAILKEKEELEEQLEEM